MSNRIIIALPVPADGARERFVNYFNALEALGAEVRVVGADVDPAAFDGLLLPGGGDIAPVRYGRRNAGSDYISPALDATQFGALDAFVRAGKPVFGICRGHQVLNVYFGGALVQHLPNSDAHVVPDYKGDRVHMTRALEGSIVRELYGASFPVNSSHHQAVDAVGEGLRVTQYSADGVVEALEHETLPAFSVQWHPERMCFSMARPDTVDGSLVIARFLSLCAARR